VRELVMDRWVVRGGTEALPLRPWLNGRPDRPPTLTTSSYKEPDAAVNARRRWWVPENAGPFPLRSARSFEHGPGPARHAEARVGAGSRVDGLDREIGEQPSGLEVLLAIAL